MLHRKLIGLATLAAFTLTCAWGCDQGTDVQLAPAQPTKLEGPKPLPKEPKKGGGPGSSGNMGKNPGANS